MVHPGLPRIDAECHIGLGMTDDVLCNAGRTFRRLEQMRDGLPQRVEDKASIKAEV
jgi:hypothetical protein